MQQEAIRYIAEALHGLGVLVYDGRIGEVRARHNETVEVLAQEQDVQGRIWQHDAKGVVLAQVHVCPTLAFFEEDYRPPERGKRPFLVRRDLAEPPDGGDVPAHEGKGLLVPPFAPPQPGRGGLVLRQAGQMHAAQALDAEDAAAFKQRPRCLDAVPRQAAAVCVREEGMRPASRAAVRLGVVAPVFNVRKLRRAVRTHRKLRHGGVGPVIWDGADDGKARPAVSAVYEGVAVASVPGSQQFPQAVRADARVRRDERAHFLSPLARDYAEACEMLPAVQRARLDALYERQRRGLRLQLAQEGGKLPSLALQLQLRALRAVAHPAHKAVPLHQPVDKGAEPHALDYAAHIYVKPCQFSP